MRRFANLLELEYDRVRLWTFARVAGRAGDNWQDDRWLDLARAIGKLV